MKISNLLALLKNYKAHVLGAIFSNILHALFAVASITYLKLFLDVLFSKNVENQPVYPDSFSLGTLGSDFEKAIAYYLFEYRVLLGPEKLLQYVCLFIVILFLGKNFFGYLGKFLLAPVRTGIVAKLRKDIYEKILKLPVSFFSEQKKGDILTKISADVNEVELGMLMVLEPVIRSPIMIILTLAFIIILSYKLTLLVIVTMFFSGFIIGSIGKRLKKSSEKVQNYLGALMSTVEESLSSLKIIKGFNAGNYVVGKFETINDSLKDLMVKIIRRKELASPTSEFLGVLVIAFILYFGGSEVFEERMEASTFVVFLFSIYNIIEPSKSLSNAYNNVQKGMGSLNRINEILYAEETIKSPENPKPIVFEKGITFKNVDFEYVKNQPVLQNINLDISKGKVVAFVGNSGAGKSTIVDLIPRFYDVVKGQILIDGVNIKDFELESLRSLFGIVTQEPILFNDSIYNNIIFGLSGVTEKDVIAAAKIANADEFIMNTENGYQTNIGDRGTKLSGGQRQRLTIARAILKNPPILILDEATSALDSKSERLVQDALDKVMKNRTALVVAHRLSTIQHADEIVVMKDGEILESGTHESLLKNSEIYQKLVSFQTFSQ